MSATLYTTTENIRAALGVTDEELLESLMVDLKLDFQLEIELDILVPTHALIKTAGENAGAGTAENKAWQKLQLLAMYQGAVILLDNQQLWAAQKISDGDAEMQRFAKDDMETLRVYITGRRDFFAGLLNTALVVSASPALLVRATPGYDPVTNEGGTG